MASCISLIKRKWGKMKEDDDITRLLTVARQALGQLEAAMAGRVLPDEAQRLFGSRASYLDLLVELGGLILKLKQARPSRRRLEEEVADKPLVGEAELSIVKQYIERQKAQRAALAQAHTEPQA
jgi:hypothetical protein